MGRHFHQLLKEISCHPEKIFLVFLFYVRIKRLVVLVSSNSFNSGHKTSILVKLGNKQPPSRVSKNPLSTHSNQFSQPWLKHLVLELQQVKNLEQVDKNKFYLFSANGYPAIIYDHLPNAIADIQAREW